MRALVLLLALAACTPQTPSSRQYNDPLYVVPADPAALRGTWYEVMRFPAPTQDGCTHVSATFTPRADGTIGLVNRCRRDGVVSQVSGVATPVGTGRLKVRQEGDGFAEQNLILGQSRDGRTIYLGTPSRAGGWVLHRDRDFSPQERDAARTIFGRNGYDEAALQRTDQR